MSKQNRQATRDAKKPASAQVVADEAKAGEGASAAHQASLADAIEHFAPLIADGAGTIDEAAAEILAELTTLNADGVKQALVDRVAELASDTGETAGEALKEAAADIAQLVETAEKIIVSVPKAFRLTLHSGVIDYPAGAYAMLKEHAEHWFAKAHGVTAVSAE